MWTNKVPTGKSKVSLTPVARKHSTYDAGAQLWIIITGAGLVMAAIGLLTIALCMLFKSMQ